ncbi:ATP-binding protein [Nocardioides campestrisoli]|uniref:ATP-binding protein n=1 Tax=Nocardioides campestrisoli TaxID=2736757 RepID=UPI0015E68CB1|nr:ATP-binding protein [Nocardioides campestrisoli]
MRARVIVLAGPSGAGKSRLAERLGLPVLRLDDFYRAADDPEMPRLSSGSDAGMVDWDDPASWDQEAAVAAIARLSAEGRAEVPVYSIPDNRAIGTQLLDLHGERFFVAEGIFAAEVVAPVRGLGLLAAAYCVRQHPLVTFWRRLARDLREHRKAPAVLVRRGFALMRAQGRVVDHAVDRGCVALTPQQGWQAVHELTGGAPGVQVG